MFPKCPQGPIEKEIENVMIHFQMLVVALTLQLFVSLDRVQRQGPPTEPGCRTQKPDQAQPTARDSPSEKALNTNGAPADTKGMDDQRRHNERFDSAPVSVGVELPHVLRKCLHTRALAFDTSLSRQLNIALGWFVDQHALDRLPALIVDPEQVPEIHSTFPRVFRFAVSPQLNDDLVNLVGEDDRYSNLSDVIRYGVCYYLSECLVEGRTEAPA